MPIFGYNFQHPGVRPVSKQCRRCGKEFETVQRRKIFCNETCRIRTTAEVRQRRKTLHRLETKAVDI